MTGNSDAVQTDVPRRGRQTALWALAVGVFATQAWYLPTRVRAVTDAWRLFHLGDRPARLRATVGSEIYDLLRRVAEETPPDATILLVTRDTSTKGPLSPYIFYHRALYHLYPRRIWWAVVDPPRRAPAWWTEVDGSVEQVLALARARGVSAVLTLGPDMPEISGDLRPVGSGARLVMLERSP